MVCTYSIIIIIIINTHTYTYIVHTKATNFVVKVEIDLLSHLFI